MDEISSADVEGALHRSARAFRLVHHTLVALAVFVVVVDVVVIALLLHEVYVAGVSHIQTAWVIAAFIVKAVLPIVMVAALAILCGDVARGKTPFSNKAVLLLRVVAGAFAACFFFDLFGSTSGYLSSGYAHQLGDLVVFSIVPAYDNDDLFINLGSLLPALGFFLMSFIFKYGILLQQVADDTV